MSVPQSSTVLVVGGGPAGSYAACVLAREGVDVVVLEADVFPRYHIGESMLASMRYFLRFIELEEEFDKHGFEKKVRTDTLVLSQSEHPAGRNPSPVTDFSVSLGQGGYSWNVIRSESDEMIFRYAEKCGAKVFDGTKVDEITFEPYDQDGFDRKIRLANPGRPVSATWSRKDGTTGSINFDYIIDASGRNGIISTKYLKNRRLNEALKNIANWTYWKGAKRFSPGEKNENSPFFEALSDGSGWVWAIPLHNGTLSCGIVARQDIFFAKKKETGLSGSAFYKEYLKMAPQIYEMVQGAEMLSDVKQASDWSYSAGAYAGPHFRLAGDAGCFIDPYFSSGVHLALTSGLSAAATIQASIKGQCSELTAAKWHTTKVNEGYTRFLLVVMTVLRELRAKGAAIIAGAKDEGYDKAFSFIQPVIQGTADTDVENQSIQKKAAEGVEFALGTMSNDRKAAERAILDKVQGARDRAEEMEKLTEEELATLGTIVRRNIRLTNNQKNLNNIANDVIDGLSIELVRGNLGLVKKFTDDMKPTTDKASFMTSEQRDALEFNHAVSVEAS